MDPYGNTAPSEAEMSPEPRCIHNVLLSEHCYECGYSEQDARVVPITQERSPMTSLDTNDAHSVSSFFQSLADKVVLASTLPKEVEELRAVVEKLKADVEAYREHNARMDEEIANLRRERQALQDENAQLRSEVSTISQAQSVAETRWSQACSERDRWHQDFITVSTALEDTKRERDDAQIRVMQLEEDVRTYISQRDSVQRDRDELFARLNSIRSALA